MAVTPSIRLVLILTFLQVYILLSVQGLTLSLKTVTKCESFTKKSPNLKAECPINDILAAESSKPDKQLSTLLPTDISISSALNSARNSPVDAKEALCLSPVITKNATIIKSRPDELPSSGAFSLSSNPFGLTPVAVSNTFNALPCPNVKSAPAVSLSGSPKSGIVSTANMALEDCVSSSTVQSANPSIAAKSLSTKSGSSLSNTCTSPNVYSPGFKSSFTVSSTCSNVNTASSNPSLGSKRENHNTNIAQANVPGNLELSSTKPQNAVKCTNQVFSSNTGPNILPVTQTCVNNMGSNNMQLMTQSCFPNNMPATQTCNMNKGSNNLPLTKSCPINQGSNNVPVAEFCPKSIATNTQTCSSNVVSSSVSSCQPNISPDNLPMTSNSASNNLPLTQLCPKNVRPQQDCLSNVGPNYLPVFQGCSSNIGCNNMISSQSIAPISSNNVPLCPSNIGLATPVNTMSSNLGTGLSSTLGMNTNTNNVNSVHNVPQNTLCNPSPNSQIVSDLNSRLSNQYQTACPLNSGISSSLPANIGSSLLTTLPQPSSAFIPSSGIPSASTNKPTLNAISGSCTNCQINQQQFSSDSSGTPLVPIIQDAIIYPTILTYPPPTPTAFPIPNQCFPSDQIPATPTDPTIPNACPMTPISKASISEYFKGVKAATSKLNDFISSFSNKFGIKSFPAMQSYSSMPSDTLLQSNTISQFPEDIPATGLPSYIPRPKATFCPALQPNIFPYADTVLLKQECPSSCYATKQDANQPEALLSTFIQSSSNNTASASSYCPEIFPILTTPATNAIPQAFSAVTCKAPVIPQPIDTPSNYPIYPAPENPLSNQEGLSSLLCNNNSPFLPLSYLPAATPSNLMSKLNFGSYNLPNLAPITPNSPNSYRPSLSSIINSAKLPSPSLPNPIVSAYDDVTNILIPDVLSAVLSTKSCPCEICRKARPFLSSISVNTSPDCNSIPDCLPAMSNTDECSVDLSSVGNSCSSSDLLALIPSLDESQLDECCKNLENIIAMLELSLSLNGGFDCDLDSVPDILSTL